MSWNWMCHKQPYICIPESELAIITQSVLFPVLAFISKYTAFII